MPRITRFGPFELDAQTAELRKYGVRIRLHEQPFRILLALLEHPGEVVLRDEIRKTLWPNDTVVEFDHSINAAIQRLRTSLSDSAEHPRYVETVARRGYRFVGTVEAAEPELPGKAHPPAVPSESDLDPGDLTGRTLSHFRLIGELGRGGMGVVYRAEDLRLGRQVALKFLPFHVEKCPQAMRERFQQEARAAAVLSHPNICTIYGVEELAGQPVIEMELIEGETLAAHLARGPLPIGKALAAALQIAAALEEAHRKGIVHRDLKPANIMLTPAGVKVLDFGLAQVGLPVAAADGGGGTARYMSPEQASGKTVDSRTDIWAFGVVLFEMLTGEPLFGAARPDEPDWSALPGETPPHVRHLLTLCVRKEPELRLRDIVAARVILGEPDIAPVAALPERPVLADGRQRGLSFARGEKFWPLLVTASAVVAVLALGAIWWMRTLSGRTASATPGNITFTQLTDEPGQEIYPSLSPDGKSVVYAGRASGNWDIYSLRVGGKNPMNLTKDSIADDTQPVFSPEGDRIAFRSDRDGGGIFVMGATGENVRRVADFGYNPAWSPDGREIVFAVTVADPEGRLSSQSQLFSVNVASGERHPITPPAGIAMQPHWSPHGYRVAYWAQVQGRLNVWTIPAGGGEALRVTDDASVDWNPIWAPDGTWLYFASDRGGSMNLWRAPINEKSGKVQGEIEPVTMPSAYAANLGFSRSGRQMTYVRRTQTTHIYRVGFDPVQGKAIGPPEPVTQGSRSTGTPNVSPDGELIAAVEDSKQGNLVVVRRDGSGLRHLTDDIYRNREPVWSPDGKLLAFHSTRGGRVDIWTIRPDGGSLRQLTHTVNGSITRPVWSPDGKRLIYSVINGTPFVIEAGKPWNSQTPQALPPLKEPDTWFEPTSWSPDGHRLVGFQLRGDGKFSGIGIYSFETGGYTRVTDFGRSPFWLKDSRFLIFSSGVSRDGGIYLMDSQSGKYHQIVSVAPNDVIGDAISPDNRWIYFALQVTEADIWMANLQ